MRELSEIISSNRLHIECVASDGLAANLVYPGYKVRAVKIIASWGGGWEHVSVSLKNRCPTWDEMCMVKEIFWKDDEVVVQFHPAKSEYVNIHPYCLHMWRKIGSEFETPPKAFV